MLGIQLAVHASFLLLVGYFGYLGFTEGSWPGLAWNLSFVLLFFACVVMHELGHSLTARKFGVRVSRILLLPIGGMAEFDRIPRRPREELLITIAGPMVNFAFVATLLPFVWRDYLNAETVVEYSMINLLGQLWAANLTMGVFNLLPVFPMDGGRILRALLALRLPYLQATFRAVTLGKVLAMAGVLLTGLHYHQPLTAVLFLFIFWAADAEYRDTARREAEGAWRARLPQNVSEGPVGNEPPPIDPPLIAPR